MPSKRFKKGDRVYVPGVVVDPTAHLSYSCVTIKLDGHVVPLSFHKSRPVLISEEVEDVGSQEVEPTSPQKWQKAADAMDALGRAMKEAFGIVEGTCPYTFCDFRGCFRTNFTHPRAPWLVCPKCGRGFCLEYLGP